MKISYQWLKELVPQLSASPEDVAATLTLHSFETVVEQKIALDPGVVVARILKLERHPNAERLQLATVEAGAKGTHTVVCGATNIKEGDIVPLALPGARLNGRDGQPFTLKESTIRGVKSPGMLTSLAELGLGTSSSGIFVLPPSTPAGSSLREHIQDDTILVADITPNRAHDCLSHIGIAREVAAVFSLAVAEPLVPDLDVSTNQPLAIEAINDVLRYRGILLNEVHVGTSPLWLQARLLVLGAKPINNVVDVTNYVMFEQGNPLHAFDAAKLGTTTVNVRRAKAGEKLKALDEVTYDLNENDLVVTAGDAPVALAGVIGGFESQVDATTSSLLLETATFMGYTVQQMSSAHAIITESSTRFSKGVTPALVDTGSARAVQLLQELAGATIAGSMEYYPRPASPVTIMFHPALAADLAGTSIPKAKVRTALERLRCSINDTEESWQVTPPIERLDITGEHDLVEEVIRLVGLDAISSKKLPTVSAAPLPPLTQWREKVRETLVKLGFSETYAYSWEDSEFAKRFALPFNQSTAVAITNPTAPQFTYLRQSLLPRLLQTVLTNRASITGKFAATERALFEISHTFSKVAATHQKTRVPGVEEREKIAGVMLSDCGTVALTRQVIEQLFAVFGLTDISFIQADGVDPWREHYRLEHSGTTIGELMIVTPESELARKLRVPVAAFECDLEVLVALATPEAAYIPAPPAPVVRYRPPSKFPPVLRDISVVVDDKVTARRAEEIIERVGKALVQRVALFDEFEPASGEGKSLAFHIAYQAGDHTLTNEEVAALHHKIVAALEAELGARLREE